MYSKALRNTFVVETFSRRREATSAEWDFYNTICKKYVKLLHKTVSFSIAFAFFGGSYVFIVDTNSCFRHDFFI